MAVILRESHEVSVNVFLSRVISSTAHTEVRLDFQPLFGKRARAPPPSSSLFGEERRPDTRERRKSSLYGSGHNEKYV